MCHSTTHKVVIMAAILVGGEKGGTGKSTVAINLAIEFAKTGQHVLLVDCDKQQTAADFAERRNAADREPALLATSVRGSQIKTMVADFARRYDVVLIDSGGQDSIELRSAMVCPAVTLMIVPVQASYFDLAPLVTMARLVEEAHVYNDALQACCLLNKLSTNPQVHVVDEAVDFIRTDLQALGLFATMLHDRVAYRYAAATGEGVTEYERRLKRETKASAEIASLYREVMGHVEQARTGRAEEKNGGRVHRRG
jgi:chromosome partitioning protein